MVQLFKLMLKSSKALRSSMSSKFIDTLRLTVRGGHGGNGFSKYGGIGGQGGCVYFVAKDGITMRSVAQKLKETRISASHGEDSQKARILGRRGLDTRIEVPLGVQVLDDRGKVLADLNEENSTCIAAGGGIGGCSGTQFKGKPGEHRTISLDLKLIADVGLVGFPNAGKSTLLKAISNARPKIGSYPFTTVRPQVGTVEYPDLRSITVADLPGLIEGAHINFGMGHKFLKHIDRTRIILMMVDINGFRLSPRHQLRNCLENIFALNKELELYDHTLLDKSCVLVLNKMDLGGAQDLYKTIQPIVENLELGLEQCPEELRPTKLIHFERILPISAKNSSGVNLIKKELRGVLDRIAGKETVADAAEVRAILERKLGERGPKLT